MFYIGVDLGTSAVKLLLMDSEGKIRKIVSKQYPISFPHPGWSEQNPVDWYEKSIEGIRELTEDINRQEVAGISFGGQMHGLVTLDGQDEVEFSIAHLDSKKKKTVKVPLTGFPDRPAKTTRIELNVGFKDENTIAMVIRDKGFGELFPASGAVVRQEVTL